ncbi:MAG: glycosyltransferase family 9 protein [Ignavibacteria bacterium]|jgi:heptosyltransferase-2|nr:glycosyltransferase family 9 protein [Ignavibacteria bacterium]MDH7526833.1 glycosyltransferase family 9 protein [Ignavibacteria bacterium]
MISIKPEKIRNILVIRKHNQIGDILVSVPMYYALKKYFPFAEITLLASKTNYPIPFKDLNPYIDEVIIYEKSNINQQLQLIKNLRQKKFDLAIVPSTIRFSSTSNIISFLAGTKYRIGVNKVDNQRNKFSFLLNIKQDFQWGSKKTHQTFRNLEVIEQINCKITISEALNNTFKLSHDEKIEAKELLKSAFSQSQVLIGLHPGAGKIDNIWDWKNFFEVSKFLYQRWKSKFLITSGATDKFVIEKIKEAFISEGIPFLIIDNYPVRKLAALINECDLFISNDTGVMHIAGLTETILISLFRKDKAYEWAPIGKNKFIIESPDQNINSITWEKVSELADKLLLLKSFRKD